MVALEHVIEMMTALRGDAYREVGIYPNNIIDMFRYDNETIFSYKIKVNEVPVQWFAPDWHYLFDFQRFIPIMHSLYTQSVKTLIVCGENTMLKICTVYYGDKYTPDYVGKLYDSIRRNCSIPFQSICISDDPSVEADIVLPYNHYGDTKKHWHKLKFFSPNFGYQNPG